MLDLAHDRSVERTIIAAQDTRRPISVARTSVIVLLLLVTISNVHAQTPVHSAVCAADYAIDAEIFPETHSLKAEARVRFVATADSPVATFELNNALQVQLVEDASGKPLVTERAPAQNLIRVTVPGGLARGRTFQLTFVYEGKLATADDSPVEGLKLAYVGDITYLLYPGLWFPVTNNGIDRFTATIRMTAPSSMRVIGSGTATTASAEAGKTTTTFKWQQASFPGTIIAGRFSETPSASGNIQVYVLENKQRDAADYAAIAAKEVEYFSAVYGPALSSRLKVVQLPDDTAPAWWAPEIAAIASREIADKVNYRILADTIARQWWGVSVSTANKSDIWMVDGGARESEMRFVQNFAGQQAFADSTKDMCVGALAYNAAPLSSIGTMDTFSPQFQALSTDKGGMIFHILRWLIGDAAFDKTMREFMRTFAGKSATVNDLEAIAEKYYGEKLTAFFAQWVDGTDVPEFKLTYDVQPMASGFRIVGTIEQEPSVFHLPVELMIETDGRTEMKRVEVAGPRSPFSVATLGKPRRVILDPNNWLLKSTPELRVRVAVRRAQELTAEGNLVEALQELNRGLDVNKNSSLVHYRIAQIFFLERNYQPAANEYREALKGDHEPAWTAVWSHIELGKIFDIGGQRELALGEYRQALATNDDTQDALEEARKYVAIPYQRDARPKGR